MEFLLSGRAVPILLLLLSGPRCECFAPSKVPTTDLINVFGRLAEHENRIPSIKLIRGEATSDDLRGKFEPYSQGITPFSEWPDGKHPHARWFRLFQTDENAITENVFLDRLRTLTFKWPLDRFGEPLCLDEYLAALRECRGWEKEAARAEASNVEVLEGPGALARAEQFSALHAASGDLRREEALWRRETSSAARRLVNRRIESRRINKKAGRLAFFCLSEKQAYLFRDQIPKSVERLAQGKRCASFDAFVEGVSQALVQLEKVAR
uniref:Uncharacterized protein n=1 Tax=Chromera velia CCMP2878 TaxID=1169474 RepID=A0A0G4F796_9ALVE|eukprot:Cvel_15602.t1-p1 / transcript=Cvel_15602.t1 / gene=Cvel_15602 / organism=Chromera_velia_CCMP2878 / gene_product=hypothetical protein / transcript_product=hypothetical protein / location=Cvel_scaffold1161:349-3893(+) / protein_length=266 / sequence_SO=supercontig / SO=protein_coding / is_pseudo=false